MRTDSRATPALDRRLLMLIEDSEADAEAIRRALVKSGYTGALEHHLTGEAALDSLQAIDRAYRDEASDSRCLPHLILLDLNLPGLDGRDVLERIKADAALRKIPVVVLSSSTLKMDIDHSYGLGANSYIAKPVSFESLTEIMRYTQRYWFDVATIPKPGA